MIQTNEGLNTSRQVANNGQDFYEDTSAHTGVWFGFMPHKDGCKVTAITVENAAGDSIDETDANVSTWIDTTADLDSFMGAPPIRDTTTGRLTKGYITSITLSSGALTLYRDTISK